ncbi:MAG TPA: hypothetical protein VG842_01080 [Sediminibacterium sp.]|nr:hypothetical protein [Sediminibacterium sp.]
MKVALSCCVFIVSLFSFIESGYTQTLVKGRVFDVLGKPVNSAYVSIIFAENEVAVSFCATDAGGFFQLSYPENLQRKALALRINAIGYIKLLRPMPDSGTQLRFVLEKNARFLPPVTVRNHSPTMKIGSDTLSYQPDSLAAKTDRVIGDIIRRIPGIDIDQNGTISYLGKPINYFYIDGENLLDNRYSLAANTIPKDMVNEIQVIERNQHIKMLNGIVPSESPALNIKLKAGKLNMSNAVKLGVADRLTTAAQVDNLAFAKGFQAINEGQYSTTGIVNVFENNIANPNWSDKTNNIFTSNEFIKPAGIDPGILPFNRFTSGNGVNISLNDMVKLGDGVAYRINAGYSPETRQQEMNSTGIYYFPTDTIRNFENLAVDSKLRPATGSITIENNKKTNYFFESLSATIANNTDARAILANTGSINPFLVNAPKAFTNKMHVIKLIRHQNYIEVFSDISFYKGRQGLVADTGLYPDLLNHGRTYLQAKQQVDAMNFSAHHYFHYSIGNDRFRQMYTGGIRYEKKDMDSYISLSEASQQNIVLPDSFVNHGHWQNYQLYLHARYQFAGRKQMLAIELPVSLERTSYEDILHQPNERIQNLLLLPSVEWQHQFGQENFLRIGGRYSSVVKDVQDLFEGVIMTDYRSFVSNNIPLLRTYSKSAFLRFDIRKSIQLLYANISLSVSSLDQPYQYAYHITNSVTQRIALLGNNPVQLTSLSGGISKYFFSLNTNVSLQLMQQISSARQLINQIPFLVHTSTSILDLKISARLSKKLSVYYTGRTEWLASQTKTGSVMNSFQLPKGVIGVHRLEVQFEPVNRLSVFLANGCNSNRSGLTKFPASDFTDIKIRYFSANNKTSYTLSGTNLTNTKQYEMTSLSMNYVEKNTYTLVPRTLFFSISFFF